MRHGIHRRRRNNAAENHASDWVKFASPLYFRYDSAFNPSLNLLHVHFTICNGYYKTLSCIIENLVIYGCHVIPTSLQH